MEPEENEPWFLKERDDGGAEWCSARWIRSMRGKGRTLETDESRDPVNYLPGRIIPNLEG